MLKLTYLNHNLMTVLIIQLYKLILRLIERSDDSQATFTILFTNAAILAFFKVQHGHYQYLDMSSRR